MNFHHKAVLKSLAFSIAFATGLSACTSVSLDEDASKKIEARTNPDGKLGGAFAPGATAGGPSGLGSSDASKSAVTTVVAGDPAKGDNSPFSKKSIYFDYDSFVLKDEFRAVVEAHAKFLNTNKAKKVVVQGNTDERGSREYNLALGQKRAEVVRKALLSLGVPDGQIEAVSFGEEKPKSSGADDSAFSENRRADLAY
jgi:peptidoglycan-associated lipoprotein